MKKLYVAILQRGWLRAEMAYTVIPDLIKTPELDVVFRNMKKCWSVPVSSNRNIIVKEFLDTDCTHLLMVDHDIVPLTNPGELVFADKDIIGMPAKIRQKTVLNWSAYMKQPDGDHYAPVDFSRVDDTIDLLKLDPGVVGTGCILISRRVLEKMTAPWFMESFDEYGICTVGEDFAFCEKAQRLGFEIYTTPKRRCEHFHEVGMLQFSQNEDIDGYYHRRENLSGKRVVIGLGSGRCGTLSLATLLNFQPEINCTHEAFIFPYQFDEVEFMSYFPKLFYRNNYGRIPGDVASWYLNYVEYILKIGVDARFICLKRDFEQTIKSWVNKTPNSNHWTKFSSEFWVNQWDKNSAFGKCFPHYDLSKQDAITKYLYDYYEQAEKYEKQYPDNFKIFDIEKLNTESGVKEILDFVDVQELKLVTNISENRS